MVIHAVAPAELAVNCSTAVVTIAEQNNGVRNRIFQVKFTQLEVDLISRTINVLSLSQDCHEMIVSGEVMYVLVCIHTTYIYIITDLCA